MASLSCYGRATIAAETKLWRQPRCHASDVRLVNRGISGQPMAARVQFDGSLGGACNWISWRFSNAPSAISKPVSSPIRRQCSSRPAGMNDRSETDCQRTIAAPPDCQAPRGRCTNETLLSGNRLQKRYLGEPVAPLKLPKNCSPIGKTRHLIIRSRLPLFRRPVRLTPQVSPVVPSNKALSICGL